MPSATVTNATPQTIVGAAKPASRRNRADPKKATDWETLRTRRTETFRRCTRWSATKPEMVANEALDNVWHHGKETERGQVGLELLLVVLGKPLEKDDEAPVAAVAVQQVGPHDRTGPHDFPRKGVWGRRQLAGSREQDSRRGAGFVSSSMRTLSSLLIVVWADGVLETSHSQGRTQTRPRRPKR